MSPGTIPLKALYRPMSTVVYPNTVSDAISTTPLTYTAMTTVYWDTPNRFNNQGQNWQFDTAGSNTQGCRNRITTRTTTGTAYGAVTDFEFLFTGIQLGIVFRAHGAYDCQVYVEHNGTMYRIKDRPFSDGSASSTPRRRNITFDMWDTRRIRFVGSYTRFVGVECEAHSVIRPSPKRPMIVIDGDSWVEMLDGRVGGSDETYYSYGIQDGMLEATGFAIARNGLGGTGYFNPGTGVTQTDPAYLSTFNSSIFFSNDRKGIDGPATGPGSANAGTWGWNMFLGNPYTVLGVVHGTQNDGTHSGATGSAGGPMSLRVQEVMNWVYDQDPLIRMVQITPESFDNYPAGGVHDLNRIEQIEAMKLVPNAALAPASPPMPGISQGIIDPGNPSDRWVTGTGGNNSPANDQQAQLIGFDNIHPNYRGARFWGWMYAKALGEMLIPADRAYARG
jgi:hypothetical protein